MRRAKSKISAHYSRTWPRAHCIVHERLERPFKPTLSCKSHSA